MHPPKIAWATMSPERSIGAPVRCILPERSTTMPPIIIGGEFHRDAPQVLFVEHNQMICRLDDCRSYFCMRGDPCDLLTKRMFAIAKAGFKQQIATIANFRFKTSLSEFLVGMADQLVSALRLANLFWM